jgi:hypothetical protein
MEPMGGRKVVESKKIILVLHQTFHGLRILAAEGIDEEVKGFERVLAGEGKVPGKPLIMLSGAWARQKAYCLLDKGI